MIDGYIQALHEHLCREEREAIRAEAVESRADFLLEEGQEYYPLDFDNFSESLSELNDFQIQTILQYVKESKASDFNSSWRNEMVARMVWAFAEDYMRDYAMMKADKEIE